MLGGPNPEKRQTQIFSSFPFKRIHSPGRRILAKHQRVGVTHGGVFKGTPLNQPRKSEERGCEGGALLLHLFCLLPPGRFQSPLHVIPLASKWEGGLGLRQCHLCLPTGRIHSDPKKPNPRPAPARRGCTAPSGLPPP